MHQAPSLGDQVRYRGQSWGVVKVAAGRVELRRGGGYTPHQYATAHHRDLHFEQAASSWSRRRAEPEWDAEAFVRGVVDRAMAAGRQHEGATRDRRVMASHEAGHATIAHVVGMRVTGVCTSEDMLREHRARGATLTEYSELDVDPDDVVVQLLAGGAAARMLCPDVAGAGRGCADDERQAREILGGPIPDALRRRVDAMVTEYRESIEAVAAALEACRGDLMIGSDITDIVDEVNGVRATRIALAARGGHARSTGARVHTWSDDQAHGHADATRATVSCPPGCDLARAGVRYTTAVPPRTLLERMRLHAGETRTTTVPFVEDRVAA